MAMTDEELGQVRDEIGATIPPTDGQLHASYDVVGSWAGVALRVLKRRRAAIAGGSDVSGFTLAGVLSVTKRTDVKILDAQIARLEVLTAEGTDGGALSTRLHRLTWRHTGRARS